MKKLFMLLLFLVLSTNLFSQIIYSGVGTPDIKIGDSYASVISILGEGVIRTYNTEKESWESSGYTADEDVVFYLNFDKVVVYNDYPANYPIFKAYFKSNKLIYLIITSYRSEESDLYTDKGLKIGDNTRAMEKAYGTNYYSVITKTNYKECTYLQDGMIFYLDNNKVRVFHIFQPFDCETSVLFLTKVLNIKCEKEK